MKKKHIRIFEARQNNLKGFDLSIPFYSLTAVTGPSGSGKSSLTLETLYAEGQRRYVETFSAYARQFLERMPRPLVDRIEDIPAAIAIEQTNPVKSSRSTLGTLTELNHFLKMFFYREARLFCPRCGRPVKDTSPREAADEILSLGEDLLGIITSPVKVKEDFSYLIRGLLEQGYFRAWNGRKIEDVSFLEPREDVEVVIDRLRFSKKNTSRLVDSLEKAFAVGGDGILVHLLPGGTLRFTHRYACAECDLSFSRPTPNLFSFNSAVGACPECRGFGRVIDVDWDLVIPNQALSLTQGAIRVFEAPAAREEKGDLLRFCRSERIPLEAPWRSLSEKAKKAVLFGKGSWYGVKGFFDWLETKRYKAHVRIFLSRYRAYLPCPACEGARYRKETLSFRLEGLNIAQVNSLSLEEARAFFRKIGLRGLDPAALLLHEEIYRRLSYLCEAGLGYLSLNRQSRTLSGGEVARAMLTRALSSSLVETLYILDEPSRGLHPRDIARLVFLLKRLSNRKNTVCVVEHDPEIIQAADHTVELGPGAGEKGGELLFAGEVSGLRSLQTPTALALAEVSRPKGKVPAPSPFEDFLTVKGARENNLKGMDVHIPKGALTVISGVSGSGKSTLLELILYRGATREKGLATERPGLYDRMEGLDDISEIVLVDQSPVGRSSRSNPASYLKLYDHIRQLMAKTTDAQRAGFKPSTFSFNAPGGRCEVCEGQGFEKVEMQFLSDLFLPCPACRGRRFRPEVLQVRHEGKNIAEILDMTLSEAADFFSCRRKLSDGLSGPIDVGLGYLRLGQPVRTLSGGEAQRLKLAHFLFTRPKERALILIDEPTVGLHVKDIERLNRALSKLTRNGNTVVIVEHNLEVLRTADWVVDLGPEGGVAGGEVLYQGPLRGLTGSKRSITATWFGSYLEGRRSGRGSRRKGVPEPPPPSGIRVLGARHHNLKSVSLDIPRDKLVVLTGLSGSGKSTLAFDIVFAEGQRRYVESLSTYVRQFIRMYERPDVDLVLGLPPTVAIEQRTSRAGPRSTVATLTEVYHYLRLLYAKAGAPHCPSCGRGLSTRTQEEMILHLVQELNGERVHILAPKVRRRKGFHKTLLEGAVKKGYGAARVDGEILSLPPIPELSRYREHTIEVSVGETIVSPEEAPLLSALIVSAFKEGKEEAVALGRRKEIFLSRRYYCPDCGVGLPTPDPLLFSFNSTAGACPRCEGLGSVGKKVCPRCNGTRLLKEALAFRVGGRDIAQLASLTVGEALKALETLSLQGREEVIARPILRECLSRLRFLQELGLGYLTLDRRGETLSGGEAQRIRLSSEMGSNLAGICYVLDEPTIGLHPRDNTLLIRALKRIRDRGNSVLVVEHDEETLREADWVIDLGPGGGERGGEVVFQGKPGELKRSAASLTSLMLRDEKRYQISSRGRAGDCRRWLSVEGASFRNLKNLDITIPVGSLSCITGVSGSGKSTLLMEVLYPNLRRHLKKGGTSFFGCRRIRGLEEVKRVLEVDHSPIGRTPRSTPATYIGVMSEIRKLMAALPAARAAGWRPGRFSFNLSEGRCKECRGQGILKVEMKFLPEVYVPCESCGGKRYNEETLGVTYRGKNISEILDMTFSEAKTFFSAVPYLKRAAEVVCDLGLGYLSLGQSSPTLSGGEAQRIKLAQEFVKTSSGGTIYFLDEPTTGLHMSDIRNLLELFHRFVDRGDTVVLIEHNPEVIKEADWVADLGPEGGKEGGELLFQGSPRDLLESRTSHTADYLRKFLRPSSGRKRLSAAGWK